MHDLPVYCEAPGCRKRLTVAAVKGGRPVPLRTCAGFPPVPTKTQHDDAEPSGDKLEAQAQAGDDEVGG